MELLMIASPKTYKKWASFYEPIVAKGVGKREKEDIQNSTENMYKFINSCRNDLEIDQIDTTTLNSVIETAQKGRASYANTVEDWLKKKNINQEKSIQQLKVYLEYIENLGEIQFRYPTSYIAVWVGGIRFALIYLYTKRMDVVLSFQSSDEPKKNEWQENRDLTGNAYRINNVGSFNNEMGNLIKKSYELAREENKK